jgi:hypothetical protein
MTVTMWLLEKIDNDVYASYFFITGTLSTELILQRASLYSHTETKEVQCSVKRTLVLKSFVLFYSETSHVNNHSCALFNQVQEIVVLRRTKMTTVFALRRTKQQSYSGHIWSSCAIYNPLFSMCKDSYTVQHMYRYIFMFYILRNIDVIYYSLCYLCPGYIVILHIN